MGACVPSYHVWLAATQMPRDGHLKTGLTDIRNPKVQTLAFRDLGVRLSYLALVDGPMLSSACEDTHASVSAGGMRCWHYRSRRRCARGRTQMVPLGSRCEGSSHWSEPFQKVPERRRVS